MFTRVTQTWHFVLSSQLATQFHPVVEEVGSGFDDLQRLQRDVLIALRLVVAVDLLQALVEE